MDLDKSDIEQILALVDGAPFDLIHIEWKGLKLTLKRDPEGKFTQNEINNLNFATNDASNNLIDDEDPNKKEHIRKEEILESPKTASLDEELLSDKFLSIKAPTVGTFYCRPEPDAAPFVELGARVSQGDTLCLVEVMKVFTAVTTPKSGIIKRILAEDHSMIEHGQTLFLIEPENG